MNLTTADIQRFRSHIEVRGEHYIWTGCATRNRTRPRFFLNRRNIDARRVMLAIAGVTPSPDRRVIGNCGEPLCVRSSHIRLGPRRLSTGNGTKFCSNCEQELPLDNFHKCSRSSDGLYNWCRECNKERKREHGRTEKGRAERRRALVAKYGLTPEEFQEMSDNQGGVCVICGTPGGKHGLCVDHCHDTGIVRGLLCSGCNAGIAMLKHDIGLLESAITYLRSFSDTDSSRI